MLNRRSYKFDNGKLLKESMLLIQATLDIE